MGTLVCRVELDKNEGLILTVENKDDEITQTAVLNGESITFTSEGPDETSTITQTPDSIAISCKDFTIDSETITCTSEKDTSLKSGEKFDIESTGNMTLRSEAKSSVAAGGNASVSGTKVSVSAIEEVEISGMKGASMSSKGDTEVEGMKLSLSGTTGAEMKGLTVDVSADTKMNVTGLMTTVEGQMTTIKGTLTKVG